MPLPGGRHVGSCASNCLGRRGCRCGGIGIGSNQSRSSNKRWDSRSCFPPRPCPCRHFRRFRCLREAFQLPCCLARRCGGQAARRGGGGHRRQCRGGCSRSSGGCRCRSAGGYNNRRGTGGRTRVRHLRSCCYCCCCCCCCCCCADAAAAAAHRLRGNGSNGGDGPGGKRSVGCGVVSRFVGSCRRLLVGGLGVE